MSQRPKIDRRELPCILTEGDIVKKAKAMAKAGKKGRSLKEALSEYSKDERAKIDKLESIGISLGREIEEGKEYKMIECKIEYKWDKNKMITTRNDTSEVVEDIKIHDYLRQEWLLENKQSDAQKKIKSEAADNVKKISAK